MFVHRRVFSSHAQLFKNDQKEVEALSDDYTQQKLVILINDSLARIIKIANNLLVRKSRDYVLCTHEN